MRSSNRRHSTSRAKCVSSLRGVASPTEAFEQMQYAIGLLGTGLMAARHSETLARHPRTRLRRVCSTERSRARGEEFRRRYGYEQATTNFEALVAPDVDVVFICSPDATHGTYVERALAAGKHVFCEKPLARNTDEFESIGRRLDRDGLILQVGMNVRYRARYRAVKDVVASGGLGELRFLRGTYIQNLISTVRTGAKPWWLEDESYSFLHGGGLHCLDLLRWVGGDVSSVFARGTGFEVPEWGTDTFSVSLAFASGALGELLVSAAAFRPNEFDLEAWLSRGAVVGDACYRRSGDALEDRHQPLETEQEALDLVLQLEDLVRALDGDGAVPNSFSEAWENFRLIQAIERSAETSEGVGIALAANRAEV
jgi:myo-inositol 2-dehydrogenase / D-chiro-inositol 1-dehydrogenase